MSHMTKLPGVPDTNDAPAGMAHFCGTGPSGTTCGQCNHRGYPREIGKRGKIVTHGGCIMFVRLTNKYGPVVGRNWPSCRYFEKKPD